MAKWQERCDVNERVVARMVCFDRAIFDIIGSIIIVCCRQNWLTRVKCIAISMSQINNRYCEEHV